MAHPFSTVPLGFSVMGNRTLWWGGCAWDSFALRRWVRPVATSWDTLWDTSPRFRRNWQVSTIIWGTATLTDAIIRVVMAATLPVNLVPALAGAL